MRKSNREEVMWVCSTWSFFFFLLCEIVFFCIVRARVCVCSRYCWYMSGV